MAVRRAIGGTRGRLIQQLITETFTLAAMGSVVGLAGAQVVGRALNALVAREASGDFAVTTDSRTLAFSVLLLIVVTLFAGLVPALDIDRGALSDTLKAGVREGSTGNRAHGRRPSSCRSRCRS